MNLETAGRGRHKDFLAETRGQGHCDLILSKASCEETGITTLERIQPESGMSICTTMLGVATTSCDSLMGVFSSRSKPSHKSTSLRSVKFATQTNLP